MMTMRCAGALLLLASGCGLFDDSVDPDGDSVVVLTDAGTIERWVAGDDGPVQVWSDTVSAGSTGLLRSDSEFVYAAVDSTISAFDPAGGGAPWATPFTTPSTVVATAGPVDGVLAVLTLTDLHGIDIVDGSESWKINLIDVPGVSDDALAGGAGNFVLGGEPVRAISAATGVVAASRDLGQGTVWSAAAAGGIAYVGSDSSLDALDIGDLAERWSLETSGAVEHILPGSPAYFAVLGGGVGAASGTGEDLFSVGGDEIFEAIDAGSDVLVGARGDGSIFAWDAASGADHWSLEAATGTTTGLVANGDTLFHAHGAVLDVIGLSDGTNLGTTTLDGSPIALIAR